MPMLIFANCTAISGRVKQVEITVGFTDVKCSHLSECQTTTAEG